MYGIDFDEYICEPMARRNLELHLHVKPNASECTKEVKAIVKGQLAIEGRKVIIFEHSAEKCNSLAETIGVSLAAENVEAISLTGREGRVFKQYVVHTFCDDNSTTKVLIGTAAIKCGINCRSCGAVVQVGFPVDIQTYAQQIGRAGRGDIEDPNNPYECHSIVSVHGFNYTFLQICEMEDKHVKLEKMLAFQESLELFVIPCGCIHQAMELRLEALGQAMNNGDVEEVATTLGSACQKCWYCWKENMLPVSSHELLRGLLECRLSDGPIPSENLGTFLFKSKAEVWPAAMKNVTDKDIRKSCNCLVLKLIASKLLRPEMAIKSDGKPTVMLKWERKKGPGGRIMLAYKDDTLWRHIPTCM
jgi:hypothetical protein